MDIHHSGERQLQRAISGPRLPLPFPALRLGHDQFISATATTACFQRQRRDRQPLLEPRRQRVCLTDCGRSTCGAEGVRTSPAATGSPCLRRTSPNITNEGTVTGRLARVPSTALPLPPASADTPTSGTTGAISLRGAERDSRRSGSAWERAWSFYGSSRSLRRRLAAPVPRRVRGRFAVRAARGEVSRDDEVPAGTSVAVRKLLLPSAPCPPLLRRSGSHGSALSEPRPSCPDGAHGRRQCS